VVNTLSVGLLVIGLWENIANQWSVVRFAMLRSFASRPLTVLEPASRSLNGF